MKGSGDIRIYFSKLNNDLRDQLSYCYEVSYSNSERNWHVGGRLFGVGKSIDNSLRRFRGLSKSLNFSPPPLPPWISDS
jgi:hypothetical protein